MKRKGLRVLAVGATMVASSAAGLGGQASAGTGTVLYDCLIFSTHFDYSATVNVTGPASPSVGDTATIEADFSDMPGVSPVAVDSWKTTGKLAVSGAQTGSPDLAGPNKTGPVAAKAPIPIGKLTGSVPLTAAGAVDVTVGDITITAVAFGSSVPISCTPKTAAPNLLTINVAPATSPVTLAVTPVSIELGTEFTVTGAGWGSGAVELALCDSAGTVCGTGELVDVVASVDVDGKLTGSAKVKAGTAVGAHQIRVTQGDLVKSVAVSVFDGSGPVGGYADKPAGQCGEQKINVTVSGGPLTMAQAPGEVDLSPVVLNGTAKTATGALKQVQVTDARGSATGWSLVGTLTDFKGAAGATIPAANLSWTPACTARDGATTVTTGTPGPLGSTGAVLCSVADSTAGPVGGVYDADAALSLSVPAVTATGEYDAILTLTLS